MAADSDLVAASRALHAAGAPIRSYAKSAAIGIAKEVYRLAQQNLEARFGGGKYTRSVAAVAFGEEGDDGGFAELQTPWLGLEFGGYVTNVHGNRIGTPRQQKIGLAPMWAPWHRDVRQGYIIGRTWSEQMDQAAATAAMADAGMQAFTDEFDKAGLKRG